MADYTKNLHLEKPLPEEFYDVSVQNGNMEKIDAALAPLGGATTAQGVINTLGALLAVAAAAAYNSSGTYAIGDYCTNDGNLYKCNTSIESGEAWNETHWTETTVAAELAAVKTELSQKLGLMNGTYTDLSAMPERPHIYLTPASGVVGLPDEWPQSRHDFVRLWCGNLAYTLDFLVSYANKKLAYRMGQTQKWQVLVTATPPKELDIPLADGFTVQEDNCKVSKTQEGRVHVDLHVNGTIEANTYTQIATLPVGYRPRHVIRPTPNSHANPYASGSATVNTAGGVSVVFPTAQKICNLVFDFDAAE